MNPLRIVQDTLDFHRAGRVPILEQPTIPPPERVALRRSLLEEEISETLKAMTAEDLVEIADGIADSIVILAGTALEYGIDLTPVWEAVHQSNMAKFPPCEPCAGSGTPPQGSIWDQGSQCPDCEGTGRQLILREDGKVLKPAGWQKPDIASVLARQTR